MLIGRGFISNGQNRLPVDYVVNVDEDRGVSGTATAPRQSTLGLDLTGYPIVLRAEDGAEYRCLVESVMRDMVRGGDRLTLRA
jgi:hypothetical protein